MIPTRLLNRSVTWTQPGSTTDGYGDTVTSWSSGTTSATIKARIEQSASAETDDATRDATATTWRLFTNETGISAEDRIVDGSDTYEVSGTPAVVDGPGGTHHVEAVLRRVDFVVAS